MNWLSGRWDALQKARPETLLIQMYSLMVALAVGLGGVILAGGDDRFNGPSFQGPRDLVSWMGVPPTVPWGLMFLALGVALVWTVGKSTAVHVLRFALVVYAFLVLTFAISAFQEPTAALTGVVAYSICGAAHLVLSVHLDEYGWQ